MKPLYPDGRQTGLLPTVRADGLLIGPVLRVLSIVVLALVAWIFVAFGFEVDEATAFVQQHCTGRHVWMCELQNLLLRQIPPAAAGTVDWLLRVGFFVLLLCLISGLLKPWLRRFARRLRFHRK